MSALAALRDVQKWAPENLGLLPEELIGRTEPSLRDEREGIGC